MTRDRGHLASLDVFRGLAVGGMILVNNPGDWTATFESLTHAHWDGCTLADLVFPFFVFILGAAMPFAFARRIDRGATGYTIYLRIARRSAWLILLGLLLNAAAAPDIIVMRLPGVLQRIGLVYLFTAPLVIHLRPRWRLATLGVLLLGHWALLVAPVFGGGGLTNAHNLAGSIDLAVFGRHLLTATGDPEGLLGTIPAIGSALLGSVAGDWLRDTTTTRTRVMGLIVGGLIALAAGGIWSTVLPVNKALWTGSFVLVTGGIAMVVLAACYVLFDVYNQRRWAAPLLWLGFNPLAIYFFAELCGHALDAAWPPGAAEPTTLRTWIFWSVLRPMLRGPRDEWVSLIFALLAVTWWTAIAGTLHRRGVRLQV